MFGMGKNKDKKEAAPAKPVAPGVASAVPASTIKRGPMNGLMQDWPLTVDKVIEHAFHNHGHREIVTRTVEGPIVRSTYADLYWRARQCSNALLADGVQKGDRIATLAWNTTRHIETWYGTMCIGAVLHTLNPRLFPEQIAWIINHAEDTHVFYDITFQPIIEAIKDKVPSVKHWIVLTDAAHKPQTSMNVRTYEEYIAGQSKDVVWGDFDEQTACGLCYTSGTTGDPKGVLYSHRSNVLHAMAANSTDVFGSILPAQKRVRMIQSAPSTSAASDDPGAFARPGSISMYVVAGSNSGNRK